MNLQAIEDKAVRKEFIRAKEKHTTARKLWEASADKDTKAWSEKTHQLYKEYLEAGTQLAELQSP